jgi:hypothetical protein
LKLVIESNSRRKASFAPAPIKKKPGTQGNVAGLLRLFTNPQKAGASARV